MNEIETLWNMLLSREPDQILSAYNSIDLNEQKMICRHLSRMATEEGWHPAQRDSARAALDVINNIHPGEKVYQ